MTGGEQRERSLLYEGKAKILYATENPDQVLQYFKDDATAFNARKRGTIPDKGTVNAAMSARLFRLLADCGVETHFIAAVSDRELLTRRVRIIPLEVVVRNRVAGSLAKRLGLQPGRRIDPPLVELYYKNDALGDPLVLDDHVRLLEGIDPVHLPQLKHQALRVNSILTPFFESRRLILVDFKLEFGLVDDRLVLADEISPDTCRLWDQETGDSLDKDRFRYDLGRIEESYRDVLRRIVGTAEDASG